MEIPVSSSDLDSVVLNVARDLLEDRAANGLIDDVSAEMMNDLVDNVVFIIERYMYYINELMDSQKLAQLKPQTINVDGK